MAMESTFQTGVFATNGFMAMIVNTKTNAKLTRIAVVGLGNVLISKRLRIQKSNVSVPADTLVTNAQSVSRQNK